MASPTYFKAIDLEAHLGQLDPLRKEQRIYVSDLAAGPLLVQTPLFEVVTLADTFAWTKPTGHFKDFLQRTESILQRSSEEAAASWGISKEQVTTCFKTFFREDGCFKVRLGSDFAAFDEEGELLEDTSGILGRPVRAALELTRVCLGKTEMGALWVLRQVRLAPQPPPCLIDLDIEIPDDHEPDEKEGGGDEEFL